VLLSKLGVFSHQGLIRLQSKQTSVCTMRPSWTHDHS
jgi:hypothetical protein